MAATPVRIPAPRLIGQPLPFDGEHIAVLATVTPFDVLMARALWQQHAEARFMALLDGTLADDFVGAT